MKLYKVGRFLLGSFFVYNGINHFLKEEEIAQYAGAKHIPQPDAAVLAGGVALLAGGTSLALGIKPKLGAASLIGFLAAVTPTIHNFWRDEDPSERMHNMVDFSKNLALLSAVVALADSRPER